MKFDDNPDYLSRFKQWRMPEGCGIVVRLDVLLTLLLALALLTQQTTGQLAAAAAAAADHRKSRRRQTSAVPPLSTVDDDPYETEYRNATYDRRAARHRFDFVNPKPGKLNNYCVMFASQRVSLIVIPFCLSVCLSVCRLFHDLQPTTIDRSQPNLVGRYIPVLGPV